VGNSDIRREQASNIEHPTSNIQHPLNAEAARGDARHWVLSLRFLRCLLFKRLFQVKFTGGNRGMELVSADRGDARANRGKQARSASRKGCQGRKGDWVLFCASCAFLRQFPLRTWREVGPGMATACWLRVEG
jgi:hypothetical protein